MCDKSDIIEVDDKNPNIVKFNEEATIVSDGLNITLPEGLYYIPKGTYYIKDEKVD